MKGLEQDERTFRILRIVVGFPLMSWGLYIGLEALDGLDIGGFLAATGMLFVGGNLLAGPVAEFLAGPTGKIYQPGERLRRPPPIHSIAESRRKAGQPQAALEAYRAELAKHPQDLQAWLEILELLLFELKDLPQAQSVYQEARSKLLSEEHKAALDRGYTAKRARALHTTSQEEPLPFPEHITFDDNGKPLS